MFSKSSLNFPVHLCGSIKVKIVRKKNSFNLNWRIYIFEMNSIEMIFY